MNPKNREIVDDFIHETYLDTLDDRGIMGDLERFSEICGKAIAETIRDGRKIAELNKKLTEIRQSQNLPSSEEALSDWRGSGKPAARRAQRIVANKRLIITAIQDISPVTAEQILRTIYPIAFESDRSPTGEAAPLVQAEECVDLQVSLEPVPLASAPQLPAPERSAPKPGISWTSVTLALALVGSVSLLAWLLMTIPA